MTRRIALWWWPLFVLASPVLIPFLVIKLAIFKNRQAKARQINQKRMSTADKLDLPLLETLELTPVVEWERKDGFHGAPGVSYLFRTDQGTLLFDVGFGPEDGVLAHNAKLKGISWDQVDALVISHLHLDHMGGSKASLKKTVRVPAELGQPSTIPCFLPDRCNAPGFRPIQVTQPTLVGAGLGSTGPLARSLFLMGWCEEQILMGRLKGKGLVVFTGCGHPGITIILEMVRKISPEPIYALGGGLHYPVTASRLKKPGLEAAMVFGTGKPPWQRITDDDLTDCIHAINRANPRHVFLSAHDTCDYSLKRFKNELNANTHVLRAGGVYQL
ncbi:metal-dependent hydrolase [Desulfosarcina variabilis str. Montpellier]|uniref:MBL fold metallo-hydrolase n=1 Tax=Desulfosarcina variabilis TaxID=2300 RepID=UPI003AFAF7F6